MRTSLDRPFQRFSNHPWSSENYRHRQCLHNQGESCRLRVGVLDAPRRLAYATYRAPKTLLGESRSTPVATPTWPVQPPPDFPYTVGAFGSPGNTQGGYFAAELNATGTALIYAGFLGNDTYGSALHGVAVDSAGDLYIVGEACCNWPITQDAFQSHTANGAGYLTILNAAGNGVLYSTFLGGLIGDSASAVAVDSSGNSYIVGIAQSANFPVTPGAFQPKNGSTSNSDTANAFIAEFTSGLFSTANAAT
jgi:hypothetical protein